MPAPPPDVADHPALVAVTRLRRLREAARAGEVLDAEDADWLACSIGVYLAGAGSGVRMEATFDLSVPPGCSPWWAEERRRERDQLIRELASGYEGSTSARAVRLQGVLRRYQATAWIRDRVTAAPTVANKALFDIFALDDDPPTGVWRLTQILKGER
jgi:hypothetical protein